MNISKKIVLGLSVFVTMLIAFVIGVVGNVDTKVVDNSPSPQITKIETTKYALDTSNAIVKQGATDIKLSYTPDMLAKGTPVMYKYRFNNPMADTMAVNLKTMDEVTGLTISYAYSDDGDESKLTTSSAPYEIQKLSQNATKYIYIILTPNAGEEVPSTFMASIKWYQGKLGTYSYVDNAGTKTFEIVSGQYIDEPPTLTLTEGKTLVGWYNDEDYTTEVTFPIKAQNLTLYAEINAEYNNVIYQMRGGKYYKAINIVDDSVSELALHNDTVVLGSDMQSYNIETLDLSNCVNLTTIEDGAFAGSTESLSTINLQGCSKLKYVGDGAFCPDYVNEMSVNLSGCTALQYIGDSFYSYVTSGVFTKNITINFAELTELTYIGEAFSGASLIDVDLSNCTKLTEIGNYAFAHTSFTSLTLPDSLLVIGSGAFNSCEFQDGFMLTIPDSVRLIGYGFLANAYGDFGIRMKSQNATFYYTSIEDAYSRLYQALQDGVAFSSLGIDANTMQVAASDSTTGIEEFTQDEIWETDASGDSYYREGEYYSALLYRD